MSVSEPFVLLGCYGFVLAGFCRGGTGSCCWGSGYGGVARSLRCWVWRAAQRSGWLSADMRHLIVMRITGNSTDGPVEWSLID